MLHQTSGPANPASCYKVVIQTPPKAYKQGTIETQIFFPVGGKDINFMRMLHFWNL